MPNLIFSRATVMEIREGGTNDCFLGLICYDKYLGRPSVKITIT